SVSFYISLILFFSTDPSTTEIYTLSLHDALPISDQSRLRVRSRHGEEIPRLAGAAAAGDRSVRQLAFQGRQARRLQKLPQPYLEDRKSTRLNSSHLVISYAVFCLKKKKQKEYKIT